MVIVVIYVFAVGIPFVIFFKSIYLQVFTSSFAYERYIATRFSSVILYGYRGGSVSDLTSVDWSFAGRAEISVVARHNVRLNRSKVNTFFQRRVKYNKENTSIEFLKVDLSDAGVYELFIKYKNVFNTSKVIYNVLEVHDILSYPLIIQDVSHELNTIVLNCLVERGRVTAILWFKEGNALQSDETHKILNDNRTLEVITQRLITCALYTCVIRSILHQKERSHLLTIDGMLFIHEFSLVASVMALVSTTTSFAIGGFIICFALKNYKVYKQQVTLTAVFVFFQILGFAFLLTAGLICICNSVYPVVYRLIEGIGVLFASATIIYILAFYLQAEVRLKSSFLTKKHHRLVFWVYGIFSMIISAVPIYNGQKNITECQIPMNRILGTIAVTVLIYVFTLGMSFVIFLKYMISWTRHRRFSRRSLK